VAEKFEELDVSAFLAWLARTRPRYTLEACSAFEERAAAARADRTGGQMRLGESEEKNAAWTSKQNVA
jgi:hypothetical protein